MMSDSTVAKIDGFYQFDFKKHGDLTLGTLGAYVGGLCVYALSRRGTIVDDPVTGRPSPPSVAQRSSLPAR